MIKEKMRLAEAFELVKKKRSIIRPNPRFIAALLTIEKTLYGSNTVSGEEINPLYKIFYRDS